MNANGKPGEWALAGAKVVEEKKVRNLPSATQSPKRQHRADEKRASLDDRESLIVRDVDGSTEGRLPLEVPIADLEAAGHHREPLLAVIRDKCIDCSGGSLAEVRKCTAVKCPLWPDGQCREFRPEKRRRSPGLFARGRQRRRGSYPTRRRLKRLRGSHSQRPITRRQSRGNMTPPEQPGEHRGRTYQDAGPESTSTGRAAVGSAAMPPPPEEAASARAVTGRPHGELVEPSDERSRGDTALRPPGEVRLKATQGQSREGD